MIKLSVIIPARSEFPNVCHTIYSILHCLEADGFDPKEAEIVLVDNCSNDDKFPQRGTGGTTSYLEGRSIYYNAVLRILRDPLAGNHSARNKGAKIARGKYLFFSDAHMAYKPGFFKEILRTVDESGGLVHGCIAWMGAYPVTESGTGYAYTIKLGEEWKGCVDEQTEILTREGWKKWNEVSMDTEFMTINRKQGRTIEYQKPRDLVIKKYKGEMIHIRHRNYDALLTPNHRVLYQPYEFRQRNDTEWKVKFAENVNGKEYLPIATGGIVNTVSILRDEIVELIGWIITEGNFDKDIIKIIQYGKHRDKIENLLKKLNISYCLDGKRKDFKIHQNDTKKIKTILSKKELTLDFLYLCNRTQLEKLYNTLIDGDGTRGKHSEHFIQTNKITVDAFQVLCLMIGKQSKIEIRKFKPQHQHYGKKPVYVVSVKKNPYASDFAVTKEKYSGIIWCPDLKNGTIFIRRSGQTMLTGNTWNNYRLADDWWYIPAQGHCSVAVLKDQFFEFGGYPHVHRTYGGGEFYTDMKWWMFGSTVAINPKAIGFHLASSRGYSYNHDDYIQNVLGVTYALGCDDWRERTYLNYLRNGRKEVLDYFMQRGEREYADDRKFIEERRKKTFNELLVERPWDKLNMEKWGKCNGAITIFHNTWLNLMEQSPQAKEAYENSKYQKDLDLFIRNNLSQFIYKGGK